MELHNRIAIPHSILSTKVNLQEGYSQNNSVHPDVHWSGTAQCGWMKWWRGGIVGEGCSEKGEESRYPGCIHPSFNRQTLTTLQESMNILYHLTCMKWFLHAQKKMTVFLVFCLLHKCLATVLVEIVLYFPCALAPFHIFENSTRCVCERKSSMVVKCVVWWHCIGGSLHSEIAGPSDSLDSSWVGMCCCWRILTIYCRCKALKFHWLAPWVWDFVLLFCVYKYTSWNVSDILYH